MYRDPTRIRSHVCKVRLSAEEDRLIEALADYTGEQKAVLVRELILEQARAVLFWDNGSRSRGGVEGTSQARICD